MVFEVRISLPPSGLFIRDLALTSLLFIYEVGRELGLSRLELSREDVDNVKIVTRSAQDFQDIIHGAFEEARKLLKEKVEEGIRSPAMLRNDGQYVYRKISPSPQGRASYTDLMLELINLGLKRFNLLDLAKVFAESKKKSINISLGDGAYPAIQPFKTESYEYGASFNQLFALKYELRLSESWYAFLALGYSLSYSGFINGELLFTVPNEDAFFEAIELRRAVGVFPLLTKILTRISEYNVAMNPLVPYVLYVSTRLASDLSDLIDELREVSETPLHPVRIAIAGNAYTLIEKGKYTLYPVVFMAKLGSACRDRLAGLFRRALLTGAGYDAKYVNFAYMLYEAIMGAKNIYDTVYYAARTMEVSRGEPRPLIGDPECLEELLIAAGKLS